MGGPAPAHQPHREGPLRDAVDAGRGACYGGAARTGVPTPRSRPRQLPPDAMDPGPGGTRDHRRCRRVRRWWSPDAGAPRSRRSLPCRGDGPVLVSAARAGAGGRCGQRARRRLAQRVATGGVAAGTALAERLGLSWSTTMAAELANEASSAQVKAEQLHNFDRPPAAVAEEWRSKLSNVETERIEDVTKQTRARLESARVRLSPPDAGGGPWHPGRCSRMQRAALLRGPE